MARQTGYSHKKKPFKLRCGPLFSAWTFVSLFRTLATFWFLQLLYIFEIFVLNNKDETTGHNEEKTMNWTL